MRITVLVWAMWFLFAQVWGQGGIELGMEIFGTIAGEILSNLTPAKRAQLHSQTSPSWPNYKWAALLYKHEFHKGEALWVSGERNECFNIHRSFMQDEASSIDTLGSCVILYDGKDCTGAQKMVYPGSLHHADLRELGLNDLISSVSACVNDLFYGYHTNVISVYSKSSNVWHKTRYGATCRSECVRNTGIDRYNYCNIDGGSWEKCSRRPGESIYGTPCLDDCGKFQGTSYSWCHVDDDLENSVTWDYCSIPFHN